jgi:hypothetical protein
MWTASNNNFKTVTSNVGKKACLIALLCSNDADSRPPMNAGYVGPTSKKNDVDSLSTCMVELEMLNATHTDERRREQRAQ